MGVQPAIASQLEEMTAGATVPCTATTLLGTLCSHARSPLNGLLESWFAPNTRFPAQKSSSGKQVGVATVYGCSAACVSVKVHTPFEHAELRNIFVTTA